MRNLYILFFFLMINETFGQTVLIPYRSGKLWGLADTLGKVRLMPSYDQVDAESYIQGNIKPGTSQYFVVRKGKKFGVLNHSTVIMPPTFYELRVDSVFIKENNRIKNNPTYAGSREILYNLDGQKLFPDTVMDVSPVRMSVKTNDLIFQVMATNNYGLFWYDRKLKKIKQWILRKAYYIGQSEDPHETTDLAVQLTEKSPYQTVKLVYNAGLDKYEVVAVPKGNRLGMPKVSRNNGNPYKYPTNNFVITTRSFFIKDHSIMQDRERTHYLEKTKLKKDTLPIDLKYDSAAVISYKWSGKVFQHSTVPEFNREVLDKIDSASVYINYVIFKKNGKTGLIAEDHIIPADYQEIIYTNPGMDCQPYFTVSKLNDNHLVKWGIIDSRGKLITPCIYDQIIRGGSQNGAWILRKDNLYGLSDCNGKLLVAPKYQMIIPNELFTSFTLKDKDKFGYISFWANERVEPFFPNPVNRPISFNGYKVFELINDKEEVVGYGDKKGFVYFKN